ncbi:DUF397 domain-containing protein [Streptomyces sp. ISL-94]|uniref:DUF397 domain-containing protein n=1 Tax=Streptomyces sp. ISL-94 TaxID=2819190 RepID=UPI001BEBD6C5|nr:DUF397 domain-containing protein [Streptomyces sp. ISL-94]MBT2482807.1 DUF397 domain-containing protein [Streptomyces sp. ISL-94]
MRTLTAPGTTWGKSSYSGDQGNCVEVTGTTDGGLAVRDSKDTTRPGIRCAAPAWGAFIYGLKASRP